MAIYDNTLDGKDYAPTHPSHQAVAGVEPYGGSAAVVVDRNRFNQLRQGIQQLGQGQRSQDQWCLSPATELFPLVHR